MPYPEMNAMVGLFEYNPPACYQALQQANKLGEIKLIGFDENELTLQAIKDGTCVGTVVQDPYQYGYQVGQDSCFVDQRRQECDPGEQVH